jgi:hypothetical protein
MVISIENAQLVGDHAIRFRFSDNTEREIDFSDFLRSAKNPMTRKYLDKELFRDFTIEHGDIVWNDFELCFPIWDLHEGKL